MDQDSELERCALDNAFLSSLARAAGLEEVAEEYADRMMRFWALLGSQDLEATFDGERLHGASGDW